jgi:hypothetical protein
MRERADRERERERDRDSDSRIVAVRSLQPTLPGIGPDDEPATAHESVHANANANENESESANTSPHVRAEAPRAPEPTIFELDDKFLVEERSGTLIDTFEPVQPPPSRPTPAMPLLRMVPPSTDAPAAIHVSPQGDPMPRTSHVPAPPAQPAPPAPLAMPVSEFLPTSHVQARPQPAPSPIPAPAPAPVLAHAPAPRLSLSDPARASLSDPMDVLFDAAYDLCFLQTAVEGAHHCIASALRAVGGRAALVHLLDVHTGEFVTVDGIGEGADRQVLARHEDDDWLLSAAVFKQKPLTMEYGGEVSSRPLPRHAALGSPQNVVIVPVIGWGRALAVFELIDAHEAMMAGGRGESALAYLAQRFAEFLGEREIVLAPAIAPRND